MEEIPDIYVDGEEETINHHPMPVVAKNTTCPTSDGFESDSVSGKGALVQPEFQLQRSCPGLLLKYLLQTLESVWMTEPQLQHCWVDFRSC